MRKKALWMTGLVICSLILAFFSYIPPASAFTAQQKLVLQSWRLVNQSYLDETFNHQNWWAMRQNILKRPLNNPEEAYTAIEEMLASLGEPFTRLLRPEQYHNLQISTSGELSGVGLQININPETHHLEVVAPLAGSPAETAGIKSRDRILKIDDHDTDSLTLEQAATLMRGKKGTTVSLVIQPSQQDTARTVKIMRDIIALSPVHAELNQDNPQFPVGYIRLSQFSANATKEVAHAVTELQKKGAKSYILDLRNNPGGLLQAGIEIARLWLDEGNIVYTVNRQGTSDTFTASHTALTADPLVVLVNQGTASASEILAGALQDNGRGFIMGEKTFGKGLIQSLFELPEGAGLAVTVAKYETPNHQDIHKKGILPDQVISQDPLTYYQIGTTADLQYQAALQYLRGDSILAKAS